MRRIEPTKCDLCGGSFHSDGEIRYPITSGPNPCTCPGSTEMQVLATVADLTPDQGEAVNLEVVARKLYDEERAAGRAAQFIGTPPWCGLGDAIRALERAGYLVVALEVAEFHAPGTPAPIGGQEPHAVMISAAGQAALEAIGRR